jgi:hypothetical protein
MGDSHNSKPGPRPGEAPPPAQRSAVSQKPVPADHRSVSLVQKPSAVAERPSATAGKPESTSDNSSAPPDQFAGKSGRVIHDERGNAVWDWLKETSRIAIDSTSRLLKRLEVPELKVEDTQPNNELSLEADRDAGGGYDPYGGSTGKGGSSHGSPGGGGYDPYGRSTPDKTIGGKGSASSARSAGTQSSRDNSSGNSGASSVGGGYDPYGRDVTRKPTGRKP